MTDEYYTVNEVSKKLKVDPQTIRRAIVKGRIQAFRVGYGAKSPYRIAANELERIAVMDFQETIKNILSYKE